jgi:hypothetical protein
MLNYRTGLLAQTGICSKILEDYTTSVIGVIPTVYVCTYPNQKPWSTGNIYTELKGRAATFKEWDYKKSRYAIRQATKQAKCQYRTKNEL